MASREGVNDSLWRQCLAGETTALERLHAWCREWSAGRARWLGFTPEESEDAAGALYVHLTANEAQHLREYAGGDRFCAWLGRVGRNFTLNAARSRRARREDLCGPEGMESWRAAPPGDLQEQALCELAALDLWARYRLAMRYLPANLQIIFRLHAEGQVPHEQIAAMLGVRAATVRKRYERARRQLAKLLLPAWCEADQSCPRTEVEAALHIARGASTVSRSQQTRPRRGASP